MAKESIRISVKGELFVEDMIITEYDKDIGETTHRIKDLLESFDGKEITFSVSSDTIIEGEIQ